MILYSPIAAFINRLRFFLIGRQIGLASIDKRQHSDLLEEGDCDTDHCLVVAEVRKRLSVIKQTMQNLIWLIL
jgi:hypothetical protein